jgi:UDP-glucose:(heptosyl)LPS alpha-1,3-glucosyltransferase
MRIVLLVRRFDPHGGGTERDLIITADCLRAAGHEVIIFAREVRGESPQFQVRPVGGLRLGRTAGLLSFAYGGPAAARAARADLVISFARTVGADVMRSGGSAHISYLKAARQWRGPLESRAMRASLYHRAQVYLERRGFASPQLKVAIAVSNLVRDDLMRQFQLPAQKVVTLYNGVDLERFTPSRDDSARREVRSALDITDGAPMVAFVGNGFGRKGLRFLIEAWPQVGRGAHLLVVGSDQKQRRYEREAMRLGLAARIHFAGAMPDVRQVLQGVDAFALPSLFEPFGNVIMEAMASGLPVLSSAQCGASELLPPSMQRFVVRDPTDTAEIAQRMNSLLDVAGELRAEARAAAESYTWQSYADKLLAIIATVRAVPVTL